MVLVNVIIGLFLVAPVVIILFIVYALFSAAPNGSPSTTQNLADTDWETLANLTGDIAALKRTAQTLNNRLNGMNKAVVPQEQIIQQMLEHQNVEQIRRGG